jgi:hypothetical protein
VHLGQIVHVGESAAHLLVALDRILETIDGHRLTSCNLPDLAFSVRFGLHRELQEMQRWFGDILTRSDMMRLQEAGLIRVSRLLDAAEVSLDQILPGKHKAMQIKEKAASLKEEMDMRQTALSTRVVAPGRSAPGVVPGSIEIDGTYERERYLVMIDGYPVRLTGKSFKYFVKLAWSRLHHDTGWIYKEDIEAGFNQARYLYRMKNEINDGLASPWSAFENNRLGYYRLNAEQSSIKVNLDNLQEHPDYEVRSMFLPQRDTAVN